MWLWESRGFSGFPQGSNGKESAHNAGNLGSCPGLGRSPGGGHNNSLQYSCLENPMDRGAWRATVHGIARNLTHTHVLFVLSCVPPVTKRRKHVEKLSCSLFAVIHLCCPAPQQEMMVWSWLGLTGNLTWWVCLARTLQLGSHHTGQCESIGRWCSLTGDKETEMVIRAQICLSFLPRDCWRLGHITGKRQKIMHV